MEPNEQHIERIARWLDGEELDLTASQRAVAEDVRRLEARVGLLLDAAVPPEGLARARRRMLWELTGGRLRVLRWAGVMAPAAAAVAILLIVSLPTGRPPSEPARATHLLLADVPEAPSQGEIDLLDKEVQDLESQLITSTLPGPEDAVLEPLWQDYDMLLMDELEVELEG